MRNKAFTLIELLVVVAIIALLLSILLPSLSGAREAAKAVVCGQHQRQFGTGIATYATENGDWFPGANTCGAILRSRSMQLAGGTLLANPRVPVQQYDWLTPILAQGQELPVDPVQRVKFIFNTYRCPSQKYNAVAFGSGAGVDLTRFNDAAPFAAPSYEMPYYFQAASDDLPLGMADALMSQLVATIKVPTDWEVGLRDYVPKLGRVGPAARKLCVADGTRFVNGQSEAIDFDINPTGLFGSFASQPAWWAGSREYGVQLGSPNWDGMTTTATGVGQTPANGTAIPISYRHGKPGAAKTAKANRGTINALFFDGHVSRLTDRESREIYLWYPSGSVVLKAPEGMTRVENGFVIP